LIRSFRQFALIGLFVICLAGFTPSAVAGTRGIDRAAAAEEKGSEPARALFFKVINFVLLAAGLGYVLRKPAADFFRSRSVSIQKSLEEGRKALETSQAQLQAVEEKLRHLEEEIAAFRASAAREIEAERQRLQKAAAEEAARILESARAQMETAVRGAKLELKKHAAREAVTLAEGLIRERLDESGRRRLVSQFAATLRAKEPKNHQA
jgi:F-type H+-transporting ATPase subunit b